jgi:hypothetical protein
MKSIIGMIDDMGTCPLRISDERVSHESKRDNQFTAICSDNGLVEGTFSMTFDIFDRTSSIEKLKRH